MKSHFPSFPEFMRLAALALGISLQVHAIAGPEQPGARMAPAAEPSLPPPDGVTELKFRDFFEMPVGPRGLEMKQKLLALDGKRVRMLGYMVHQEEPHPGFFLLAPVPVSVAEASDGMADDLPPATLFVHLPAGQEQAVAPYQSGLLHVTGILGVGSREEADGRISLARLQLDAPVSDADSGQLSK